MARIALLTVMTALLTGFLTGCVTVPETPTVGTTIPPTIDPQRLATDAVQQLVALYAPTQTRLDLQQVATDALGQSLLPRLRDEGYAVREFAAVSSTDPAAQPATRGTDVGAGLPFRYVLDQVGAADFYQLTLRVGAQSLTRPYQVKDGALVPAGYWVRKE